MLPKYNPVSELQRGMTESIEVHFKKNRDDHVEFLRLDKKKKNSDTK